jgi:S1-C subfamily serine protease
MTACAAKPLREVYKAVDPSVVLVHTEESALAGAAGPAQDVAVAGLGSGVLVSEDGLVLTAAHVVQVADRVLVEFVTGETVWAEVLSSEPAADIALVRVERVPEGAVVARLGDSDRVEVGDQVFVIGAPYGVGHSLSVGYLSGRHRGAALGGDLPLGEFLQTDAAINQGNSGGPMFNRAGEVIGIVSHIMSQSGGFEGLGFAVSANAARELLLERPAIWSGMAGYRLAGQLAGAFNIPQPVGILVQRVARGSIAERLGLQGGEIPVEVAGATLVVGGDVILGVQGIQVGGLDSYRQIRDAIEGLAAGDEVRVEVLRGGRILELSAYWLP